MVFGGAGMEGIDGIKLCGSPVDYEDEGVKYIEVCGDERRCLHNRFSYLRYSRLKVSID